MRAGRLTGLVALALATALAAGCGDDNTEPVIGSTPAFLDGQVVTIDYTQQFQCTNPPASGATSKCEVGAEAQTRPTSGVTDTIWVLVPTFAPGPDPTTLHCPTAGACPAHPSTVDVSAALGAGTENIATPPHSHILSRHEGETKAWQALVVAINDAGIWNNLVAGKSVAALRAQQQAIENAGKISADLPSNLFLFFRVRG
jgi:hypothetical protein